MKKITDNMQRFCEEYVKHRNGAKAYGDAYEQKNKNICAVEAHKFLRDRRILDEIERQELAFNIEGHKAGITRESLMKIIANMLYATKKVYNKLGETIDEVPDNTAINNAVVTYAKLTGEMADKKKIEFEDKTDRADVDLDRMTEEERKEYKAKILRELQTE